MTIDSLPDHFFENDRKINLLVNTSAAKTLIKHQKQIVITKVYLETTNEEPTLTVEFKLLPNKTFFSKIKSDLWLDKKLIKSFLFDILHSFGSTDEFYLKVTIDPNGISPGLHLVKVEMNELSSFKKEQVYAMQEINVEYKRENRKTRLRKIPLVKKVEGQGIVIISSKENDITQLIGVNRKKELLSKRDTW